MNFMEKNIRGMIFLLLFLLVSIGHVAAQWAVPGNQTHSTSNPELLKSDPLLTFDNSLTAGVSGLEFQTAQGATEAMFVYDHDKNDFVIDEDLEMTNRNFEIIKTGTSLHGLRFYEGTTNKATFGYNGNDVVVSNSESNGDLRFTSTSGAWRFVKGSTEYFTILSNGNVGIETATPAYRLQVDGDADIIGELTAASDQRLKRNISMVTNAIDIVCRLRPMEYDFRLDEFPDLDLPERRKTGFLAQDMEEVLPRLVSTGAEVADIHGNKFNSKSVNYVELIPILTKAIQEQQETISILQKKIAELEDAN